MFPDVKNVGSVTKMFLTIFGNIFCSFPNFVSTTMFTSLPAQGIRKSTFINELAFSYFLINGPFPSKTESSSWRKEWNVSHCWKERVKIGKVAKFGGEMSWNAENVRLRRLQILCIFVLCRQKPYHKMAEIHRKWWGFSVRNAGICRVCELCRRIFSVFCSISPPSFAMLLILRWSF